MGVLYAIDGANETVLAYAARHDRYNPVARDHARDDLRLLLGAVRRVITGQLVLTTSQQHSLLAAIDVQIEAL